MGELVQPTTSPLKAPAAMCPANDAGVQGGQEWFSAAELAALALPGLPTDKRGIARRAQDERWSCRTDANRNLLVRPRRGRGGGVEFHVSLLPGEARLELSRRFAGRQSCGSSSSEAVGPQDQAWSWYEGQSARVKREATRRLDIVTQIGVLEEAGTTRSAAIAAVCARCGVGQSTLWGWLRLVEGVDPADRLPALAPRHKGGGKRAEIDPEIWQLFKSDMLRMSGASLSVCYRKAAAVAAQKGLSMPSEKAFRRRFEREVDPRVALYAQKGDEALRRSIPAQRRRVEHLRVLEMVNVDGHKFDVLVTPPDGGSPVRPIMVAIQDVRSSKLLAWRLDLSENAVQTRLAFADLFREYGIPRVAVLDNGRAFASKWISGGARTRYRFKIKPEEPTGVLTGLGIEVRFALPYRGQSKPIERAFRDLCDSIARDAAAEGAYTGNSPVTKPDNYGARAMAWDEFEAHVARQIAFHNARLGRSGRDYKGRSFDQVFAEGYAAAPVGKATEAQLRLALLAAERKRVNRQTCEIELFGNRYWHPDCGRLAGEQVTVRFDPDNLHSEVHLYDNEARYLLTAQIVDDSGFDDVEGAKATAKRLADYRRMVRDGLEAEQLLAAEQIAAIQAEAIDRMRGAAETLPEPGAVRPVRHRGSAAALAQVTQGPLEAPRTRTTPEQAPGLAPIDRMARAVALRLVEND